MKIAAIFLFAAALFLGSGISYAQSHPTLEFISCDIQSPHFSFEICMKQYEVWLEVSAKSWNPTANTEGQQKKVVLPDKKDKEIARLEKENADLKRKLETEKTALELQAISIPTTYENALAREKTRTRTAEKRANAWMWFSFILLAFFVLEVIARCRQRNKKMPQVSRPEKDTSRDTFPH